MIRARTVIIKLSSYASEEKKKTNEHYFKTGKGEYAKGDIFIGLSMPTLRNISKKFIKISYLELQKLIENEIHEVRLCGLLILILPYKSVDKKDLQKTLKQQTEITNFYLKNTKHINNWDLVDCSAHLIIGQSILDSAKPRSLLFELIKSPNLWERRIGIISTWILIRSGDIKTPLQLSEKLLSDKEDLIQKATGWMLRAAWKRNPNSVEDFVIRHYQKSGEQHSDTQLNEWKKRKESAFSKGNLIDRTNR